MYHSGLFWSTAVHEYQKVALEYENVLQNKRNPKFGLTQKAEMHLQSITAMGFSAMFTFQLDNTK